jgi:hypothetical protein
MKTNTFKTLLGSALVTGALIALPTSAFALDASTTASMHINKNGIVRVVNAEVTSVSGNLITAVTRFKDTLANWVFTTNASTTIKVGAGATSTPAGIQVGDKISVAGALTSFGSTLGVNATKVLDLTTFASWKGKTGTVTSINNVNGTFVIDAGDKNFTVQTNASTTWATGATTTASFANLTIGTKVKVRGMLNTDKTVLTASSVTLSPVRVEVKKENNGSSHGLKNGHKDKEDRDNPGKHNGFLKLKSDLGFGLGLGDR